MTEQSFRLAGRLREARQAHQPPLSQGELARRAIAKGAVGLNPAVVSRIELGYRDARWSEVVALAAALGLAPDDLTGKRSTSTPAAPAAANKPAPSPIPATASATKSAAPPLAAKSSSSSPENEAKAAPALPPVPVATSTSMSASTAMSAAATPPAPDPRAAPEVLPTRDGRDAISYRQLLVKEISRANAALADRSLPPAIWRGWRSYLDRARGAVAALT